MDQLNLARDVAIGLGGSITDNTSGFITCFATEDIAIQYVLSLDDLDEIEAERQDRCAVVIKISSLL
ncbi:MAG: hypothetical protein F6K11_12975 [Leptolyngbya sp. SIO3F4]|nr:hypothetical protein [Leptolyngbya sp. SIO3F4]